MIECCHIISLHCIFNSVSDYPVVISKLKSTFSIQSNFWVKILHVCQSVKKLKNMHIKMKECWSYLHCGKHNVHTVCVLYTVYVSMLFFTQSYCDPLLHTDLHLILYCPLVALRGPATLMYYTHIKGQFI